MYTGIRPGGLHVFLRGGGAQQGRPSQHPSGLEIKDFIDTGRDLALIAPPPCVRLFIYTILAVQLNANALNCFDPFIRFLRLEKIIHGL